jgi:hypothetical protein
MLGANGMRGLGLIYAGRILAGIHVGVSVIPSVYDSFVNNIKTSLKSLKSHHRQSLADL